MKGAPPDATPTASQPTAPITIAVPQPEMSGYDDAPVSVSRRVSNLLTINPTTIAMIASANQLAVAPTVLGIGKRYGQTAIIYVHSVGYHVSLADLRQRQDYVEPEEELHQQRHVSEEFDIDQRDLGHDPVARHPSDAYYDPQRGRQYHTDYRDDYRVRRSYDKGVQECVR